MTTPPTGSPDFQRQVQSRTGNLFAAGTQTLAPGQTSTAFLAMQSWPGVLIRVKPSAGYGTVTVYWYDTADHTYFIGSDSWDVNANTGLFVNMPCQGAFMVVTIDVTSATDMTADTYLFGISNGPPEIYYPITKNGAYELSGSVAASATSYSYLPWITKGLAWTVFDAGANGPSLQFRVQATDASGSPISEPIDYYKPSLIQQALFALPEHPIRVAVTNLTTIGPLTYSFTLVTQGTG